MSLSRTGSLFLSDAEFTAQAESRWFSNTLLTALVPVIWGSTYLVTTEWLPPGRPFTAACIRTLPAGLALILWQRHRVPPHVWPRLLLHSLLNIGLFQSLLFFAAYRLPGGIAAILGATMPLLVMTLNWAVNQARPTRLAIGAGLAAVAGMATIFAKPQSAMDPLGLIAAAGGTACLALGTFLSGRHRSSLPVLAETGWQLVLAGLLLAPVAWLMEPPLEALQPQHVAGYAYLSLVGAMLSYPLWFRGIKLLSASAVSALGLLSPLTAITLGWLFLQETFGPRELLGMIVVLAAAFTLQWAQRARG